MMGTKRPRLSLGGWVAIAAIAALAVTVRFARLGWGLSDRIVFVDEQLHWWRVLAAFAPPSWSAFLPAALTYPTLLQNLAGSWIVLASALGWTPPAGPALGIYVIWVARVSAALASLGTVAVVGVCGARFYSRLVGLAAAALMAVVPLEVLQAHYASADPLLNLLMAATLFASLELARRGGAAAALAAGAAAGLGFSAKYTGLAFIVAPGWAALEIGWRARSVWRLTLLGAAAFAGFALAFSAGCPQCVLRSDLMLHAMGVHHLFSTALVGGASNNYLVPSLGWYGKPYLYELVASLPWAFGWPLYGLVLLGVARAARVHGLSDRVILAPTIAFFLAIASSAVTWPRYLLPMFPGLILLAARWVGEAARRPALRAVLFGGVLAYTLALTLSQVWRFSWEQQKGVAALARIALYDVPRRSAPVVAYSGVPGDYLRLDGVLTWSGLRPVAAPSTHWLAMKPDAFVLSEWEAISIRRDRPNTPAAAELDALESGAAGYTPVARWRSHYLQDGFYRWLDPAFAADLWQGETGFTLYLRDDHAHRLEARRATARDANRALGASDP